MSHDAMIEAAPRHLFEYFHEIQKEWGMNLEQLSALTHAAPELCQEWLNQGAPSQASHLAQAATVPPGAETLVPFVAIYKKLKSHYSRPEDQAHWLTSEHKDFAGAKPIDVAASSVENLYWLAYYLESSFSGAHANSGLE